MPSIFMNRLPWSDYSDTRGPAGKKSARGKRAKVPGLRRRILRTSVMVLLAVWLAHAALVLLLRWVDVPFSAFMVRAFFQGHKIHYDWVDWNQISPSLAIAVVASEDQRFPEHWGFDFKAIADALEENRNRSYPRGASTISQQTAKNLFLWPGRSWLRKGLEAYTTLLIESLWPKQRILEVYLNIAEFGPGVFGAGAAGRLYFKTPANRLSLRQASLMAAVLPNPHALKLRQPSGYVRQRAGAIRRQVALLGGPGFLAPITGQGGRRHP